MNTNSSITPPSIDFSQLELTGPATAELKLPSDGPPIRIVANEPILRSLDPACLQQAVNARLAPGVRDLVVNPDAHLGFGAPTGSVLVSDDMIYPGPVGLDIKCSMSFLQLDVPQDELDDPRIGGALLSAICRRVPTGIAKNKKGKTTRRLNRKLCERVVTQGATTSVLAELGIPETWSQRCEDAFHVGHDGTTAALESRLDYLLNSHHFSGFCEKANQLGSLGGGNHFGECQTVRVNPEAQAIAQRFGLRDGHVGFLTHCGSRGFGHKLATQQFQQLQDKFARWRTPLPANDKELVYAPLGTPEANAYIDDIGLAGNFATLNHLQINAHVLDAFQQVLPGCTGELVYFISHNVTRLETHGEHTCWVHRKGATRAFPAGHPDLLETEFHDTGHPILLPGNPRDGSKIMVAEAGAANNCFSVNHGAGRRLGRQEAKRQLDPAQVTQELRELGIQSNGKSYPIDEAPDAYKNFADVIDSVTQAGLASEVAQLDARFVIKDNQDESFTARE